MIRGKQIKITERLNEKARINSKAKNLINEEIRYISSFFPNFNNGGIHNQGLIFIKGMLLFYQPETDCSKHINYNFKNKLINLLAGIELLGLGTNFHNFYFNKTEYFDRTKAKNSGAPLLEEELEEKDYTLKLLFGDIFYSRAVIYLLKFQNYNIFDRILKSLKTVHNSKLMFHRLVREQEQEQGKDPEQKCEPGKEQECEYGQEQKQEWKQENEQETGKKEKEKNCPDIKNYVKTESYKNTLSGINALFTITMELGIEIFKPVFNFKIGETGETGETKDTGDSGGTGETGDLQAFRAPGNNQELKINQVINDLTLLKSCTDIENFLKKFPPSSEIDLLLEDASHKKNFINGRLNDMISKLKPPGLFINDIRELISCL